MKTLKFLGYECRVGRSTYHDGGGTALFLLSAVTDHEREIEEGEPIATITVNPHDYIVPNGFVAIKDWSENAGMLELMMEAGIATEPMQRIQSGFVQIPICKLDERALAEFLLPETSSAG